MDGAVAGVTHLAESCLDGDSSRAMHDRQALAERLQSLSDAAGRLSDRLSLKHFSLIDTEMRTVAA
jgi:hypothetical protein